MHVLAVRALLPRAARQPAALTRSRRERGGRVSRPAVELVGRLHADDRATRRAKCCAAPPASSICSGPASSAGITPSPPQQLVLGDGKRSGSTTRIWTRPTCAHGRDAREHAGDAVVGDGIGQRAVRHQGAAGRGGLRWFQLLPKHQDTRFSAGAHRLRQGRRARVACSSRTSSNRSRSLRSRIRSRIPSSYPTCSSSRRRRGRCDRARQQVSPVRRRYLPAAGRPPAAAIARGIRRPVASARVRARRCAARSRPAGRTR